MESSALGSGGDKEKVKGKEKEREIDIMEKRTYQLEKRQKFFQKALPWLEQNERMCRLIKAKYDKQEYYKAWLHNLALIESDGVNESVWRSELNQQHVKDAQIAADTQEMQKDGTRNAERD